MDRVLPTNQRLESNHRVSAEGHDRLVPQRELLPVDGAPQIGLELQPLNGLVMHRGVEHRVAVATRRLRAVHGDVGIPDKVVTVAVLGRADGDTDARAREDLLSVESHGRRHRLLKALGDPDCVARVADVLEQHREFVASEAGQTVLGVIVAGHVGRPRHAVELTQDAAQPVRNFEQESVAGRMANAVVDGFEPIQIDEQHGESVVRMPHPAGDLALQAIHEQRPVRQLRQVIVKRIVDQAFLGAAQAAAHVVERHGQGRRFRASP